MYKLHPFITDDGSVGLYDTEINDIYHSATGAVEEAYEKFVQPADIEKIVLLNDEIKLLDICYGIGYNSKIFLNFLLNKNFLLKKNKIAARALSEYNGEIYDNNIINKKCNATICSDNVMNWRNESDSTCGINFNKDKNELIKKKINFKISITAIDCDKILGYLSPFVTPKKFNKFLKNDFRNKKIDKFRNDLKNKTFNEAPDSSGSQYLFGLHDLYSRVVNLYILYYLFDKYPDILSNQIINNILSDKGYQPYLDTISCHIFKQYKSIKCKNTFIRLLNLFLHNIYYKYISSRYKNDFKALKNLNIDFNMKFNDARNILKTTDNTYNIIFLDAFTPSIAPILWTYDFIKILYDHIDFNGVLITYTTAAPVRNAMIKAGFYVGRIYNSRINKYLGTIASKNKELIKNGLSEYEQQLLNTKAGIVYRDPNLSASNLEIINNRKEEINISTLMSASELKKKYK